uniref:Uncharacterized protein n=1 Tax=Tanacetum cinerariifolium TaxID=118510 RepID=A0A699WYZ2_TANCI|nr:hypothetical protein [Tanacetum cinerariifolium]
MYWDGFLRVCVTFKSISDIIPNLLDLLYLQIDLHGYGVYRKHGYAVLGIGQRRFLVKSWRRYVVSLQLDTAYW